MSLVEEWDNSQSLSQKSRLVEKQLLEDYFPSLVNYRNVEDKWKEYAEDCQIWLRVFQKNIKRGLAYHTVERKTYGYENFLNRNIKRRLISHESISNIETNSLSSSIRNPKADFLMIVKASNPTETEFELVGLYHWRSFANWFEQHYMEFEEFIKTNSKDGRFWKTSFRFVPVEIMKLYEVPRF